MSFQIRQLSYALGAEIIGIDIRQPLDDKSFSGIRAAFLEHTLLLFRGLPLTREQHMAFSRRFGALDENEAIPRDRDPQYPNIKVITNKPKANATPYVGEVWHTDRSFTCVPPGASLLRAVEIAKIGGDTLFSNLYLAYETLSDGMKKALADLYGVHAGGKRGRIDASTPERLAETQRRNPPVAQPVVRVHPETGRKALFVTEHVKQLAGMTAEESKPLIDFLCAHAARPQFIYRHQWQKDDLLVWDNRCTMHMALSDYDRTTQTRHMERTAVVGTPSGYVYEGLLQ